MPDPYVKRYIRRACHRVLCFVIAALMGLTSGVIVTFSFIASHSAGVTATAVLAMVFICRAGMDGWTVVPGALVSTATAAVVTHGYAPHAGIGMCATFVMAITTLSALTRCNPRKDKPENV